jgi:hypothetical protein
MEKRFIHNDNGNLFKRVLSTSGINAIKIKKSNVKIGHHNECPLIFLIIVLL